MKMNPLLVSSCLAVAVLGTTAMAAAPAAASAPAAKSTLDNKQKPPDKPKPKAPDKPKPPSAKKPEKEKEKPKETPAAKKAVVVGSEVDGTITMTDLDSKAHKLSDLRGKVVVINFWSAHSADSNAYDKRLAEIATTQGAKGVVFIGIDSDKSDFDPTVKDPKQTLHDALKKSGLDDKMVLVLDKDGALMSEFAAKQAPYALVIDGKGVLRYSGPIDDDPKGDKKDAKHFLTDAINAATTAKPEPPPAGGDGKTPPPPPKKG
jgi:thiol-disulfide isomerase/thioredoxin